MKIVILEPQDYEEEQIIFKCRSMTPDELKTLPKCNFILAKTGCCPMRTILKLFLKWGITFDKVYTIEEKSARKVAYADRGQSAFWVNRQC